MRASLSVAVVLAAISFSIQADDDAFEIISLSNRADLISGGDALVEVRVPKGTPLSRVVLRLPGYSVGADAELEHAMKHGVPVFHGIDQLIQWREGRKAAVA
jgi:hypothetical protein